MLRENERTREKATVMFTIRRYTPADKRIWDLYVAKSKNATFLFRRDYMDYHSDRFADYSLLFFKGSRLYALLPANIEGDTLFSHHGLTYGGLIMDKEVCTADVLVLF